MTLKECYTALGGDLDDVLARLRSERMVQKFVLKFPEDGSFDLLCDSFAQGNWEDAFRASHTIKGMCQNLSFTALGQSSHDLTEALRGGKKPEADGLLVKVKEDYRRTVEAIEALRASL